jgi:flagellar hook-basal body complex protein FliE
MQMNQLLAEMQRLSAGAQGPEEAAAPQEGFSDLLKASLNKVNEAQGSASDMAAAFERGDASTSLHEVMVALQKASISFQAMTEIHAPEKSYSLCRCPRLPGRSAAPLHRLVCRRWSAGR